MPCTRHSEPVTDVTGVEIRFLFWNKRIVPQGYLPPQPLMLRGRRLAPRPRWGLAMTAMGMSGTLVL